MILLQNDEFLIRWMEAVSRQQAAILTMIDIALEAEAGLAGEDIAEWPEDEDSYLGSEH